MTKTGSGRIPLKGKGRVDIQYISDHLELQRLRDRLAGWRRPAVKSPDGTSVPVTDVQVIWGCDTPKNGPARYYGIVLLTTPRRRYIFNITEVDALMG